MTTSSMVVTHAVNDFCVVELSNFYLDIIKDRLYCDETDGLARRSAQTALYPDPGHHDQAHCPHSVPSPATRSGWPCPTEASDDGRNVLFNDMNRCVCRLRPRR